MAMTASQTETRTGMSITPTAAAKAAELLDREVTQDLAHHQDKQHSRRVAVHAAGCARRRYALYVDGRRLDGDQVATVQGVEVRVDKMSAPYLAGAEIDYLDTLQQSGFTISNPNAKGTCACGDSAQF